MAKKRIALITNETSVVGGLPTLVKFLHRVLKDSGRYEAELISLGTSFSDSASLRFIAPHTWLSKPQTISRTWNNESLTHVGAWGSEFEFQRYRPRRLLTSLLGNYDLLQFIVGSPPWACVAEFIDKPVMIWTATTTRLDRNSQMKRMSLARRAWSYGMLPITEHYEKKALRAANAVFALSQYTRDTVLPIVDSERLLVAPCGVDTSVFTPASTAPGNYILCVGRLSDPRKNISVLLNAYALLLTQSIHTPDLYLVGDLPTEENRRLIESLGVSNKVRLLGPQDETSLAELYRNALFFVLSSDEEGLGIVILEAMASGLSVITTDCGGPSTMVIEGKTGFLTPVGDSASMCKAMNLLLSDPELRRRLGTGGRRVVEERFSMEIAGRIFLEKYEEVLHTGEGRNQFKRKFVKRVGHLRISERAQALKVDGAQAGQGG